MSFSSTLRSMLAIGLTSPALSLAVAWAMSIHKAQGQTLERVKVDLRRIFEKGQAVRSFSLATRNPVVLTSYR